MLLILKPGLAIALTAIESIELNFPIPKQVGVGPETHENGISITMNSGAKFYLTGTAAEAFGHFLPNIKQISLAQINETVRQQREAAAKAQEQAQGESPAGPLPEGTPIPPPTSPRPRRAQVVPIPRVVRDAGPAEGNVGVLEPTLPVALDDEPF